MDAKGSLKTVQVSTGYITDNLDYIEIINRKLKVRGVHSWIPPLELKSQGAG